MESLLRDLRYSVRGLLHSPGFAAAAIVSLGLGIGANAAIFSIVDAILLRPFTTIPQPERLLAVYTAKPDRPYAASVYADYVDYRERNHSFSGLAAYDRWAFNLSSVGETRRVEGLVTSVNYFSVLGIRPVRGRGFLPGDGEPGAEPVAVISHELWRSAFGGAPNVTDRSLVINGTEFTIVGVTPPGFRGLDLSGEPDVWIPLSSVPRVVTGFFADFDIVDYTAQRHGDRRLGWLQLVGRLRPGIDPETAAADMSAVARGLRADFPSSYKDWTVSVLPAELSAAPLGSRGDLVRFSALLLGVVGLALLIACSNVAHLLLVRATARTREIGIRMALGASRWRLVRQLTTESVLLAVLGGAAGLVVAVWGQELLTAFELPGGIAIATLDLGLDPYLLAFAFGLSVLTGLLFGLAPALHSTRPRLIPALKEGARTTGNGSRWRPVVVSGQVALCLVLLVGAGLFLRSLKNGLQTDLGFESDRLLLASLDLGLKGYDEAGARTYYQELLLRVESLPGVVEATLTSAPFGERAFGVTSIFLDGTEPPANEREIRKHLNFVGPDFVKTMGLPLIRGRDLRSEDFRDDATPVAVINRSMVRRYWPGEDPIGERFRFAPSGRFFEVVGVVEDAKYETPRDQGPYVYMYLPEVMDRLDPVTLVTRAAGDPGTLVEPIRGAARAVDPDLPLFDVETMSDRLGEILMPQRMGSVLLSLFGVLALVLASLGVYGVAAYTVARRTREIGVRMALGAGKRDVLRRVIRVGFLPVATGIVLGGGLAVVGARFASRFLYEVPPADAPTLLISSATLVAAAALALYVPARRAARIDPMAAIRYE